MKVKTILDPEEGKVKIIIDVEDKGLRLIMDTDFRAIAEGIEALYNTQKNPLLRPALGVVSDFLGISFRVVRIDEGSGDS